MQIIHTSPVEIKEITKTGLFDDCLFFSADEYAMGKVAATYTLEINEDKIVDVSDLYNEDVINNIVEALDVTEEEAQSLLDGSATAYDFGKDGEDDWWIQAKQGECAKLMGYEACEAQDEQGAVYIVPMLNRINDLVKVG